MKKTFFVTIMAFSLVTTTYCQNITDKKSTQMQEDVAVNDYLKTELQPIRDNFSRINAIANWTEIKVIDLMETTEGGEAKYYYLSENLDKISTQQFGETFQTITEYYLKDAELSFVFEKTLKYNRPFYYDSIAQKENNDTEAFDFNKSEIIEDRSYFNKGTLIHQLNNQDCGSPFTQDYLLEEQKRIIIDFETLLKLVKTQ